MPTETPDRPDGLAIGDNIAFKLGDTIKYYRITNRDAIYYRDAHSALASAATETFAEITNLNPPDNQIYQFYGVEIDGNVQLTMKQPAAVNRLGTNRSPTGGILTDVNSPLGNPALINLWIARDLPPNAQLLNSTDISITTILWWIGWAYEVVLLSSQPEKFTLVVGEGRTR